MHMEYHLQNMWSNIFLFDKLLCIYGITCNYWMKKPVFGEIHHMYDNDDIADIAVSVLINSMNYSRH
jgi:hypothetical protein